MLNLPTSHPLVRRALSAIPTEYAGVNFRSRLEAKWAAMFDLLEWEWEYEPFDLDGYIPDFVLKLARPVLVEVKPWVRGDDARPLQAALDAQAWDGEIWIAGSQLGDFAPDTAIGLLRDSGGGWDNAILSECVVCDRPTMRSDSFSWHCRACGGGEKRAERHIIGFSFQRASVLWKQATNRVQWKGRKG
jgi:hypothetical protein